MDTSNGEIASAAIQGNLDGKLSYTIEPSFTLNDKTFHTKVTLTNTGSTTLTEVRFMREVQPELSLSIIGGGKITLNTIERTFSAGDSFCAVSAQGLAEEDPYFLVSEKQPVMAFSSSDSRCRVFSGFLYLYDSSTYDSPPPKGSSKTGDNSIVIAFDVGTLSAGASTTLTYDTTLDAGNIDEIISALGTACSGPALSPPISLSCFSLLQFVRVQHS